MQDKENLDEDEKLKPEIIEQINKVYLASLIKDWKNIKDGEKKIDVTDKNKIKLMENTYINKFVVEKSSQLGNYRKA
jgi:hypothetical protein